MRVDFIVPVYFLPHPHRYRPLGQGQPGIAITMGFAPLRLPEADLALSQ